MLGSATPGTTPGTGADVSTDPRPPADCIGAPAGLAGESETPHDRRAISGWYGTMIGAVVGVLGLVSGFYFYWASITQPDLTFCVNPTRTIVVRQGQTSRLSILLDGKAVLTDVSAAQVVFWNRGREPLRPGSVLEPFSVRTKPAVPILDVRLKNINREVSQVTFDRSRLDAGVLGVGWRVLERGDGAAVQIVYAGDSSVEILGTGVFEGQSRVSAPPFPDTGLFPSRLGVLAGFVAGMLLPLLDAWRKRVHNRTVRFSGPVARVVLGDVLPILLLLALPLVAVAVWESLFGVDLPSFVG